MTNIKTSRFRAEDCYGWVIHPLTNPGDKGNSPGKKPLLPGWQKLTATPQDIEKYISQGCNLGLVCGKASDVTVLDFDHFLFLEQVFNGFDLETLRSKRTEGRGHVYFKYNPNLPASKHHDLGIEVLSDGNNAVIPPSVHALGDVYKWSSPDAPIIEMPKALEANLKKLFQTETELKQIIGKCRTCFRNILKDEQDMHGAEGREYMLALCADLKAKGATEDHARMFVRLMYGKDYDEARTLQEWRNIDASRPWRCETLKAKLPAYIDPGQCEICDERRHNFKETIFDEYNKAHPAPETTEEYHLTDLGNAQRIKTAFGEDIRYCHPTKTWLVWDGQRWNTDKVAFLEETCAREVVKQLYADALAATDLKTKDEKLRFALKSESVQRIAGMIELAKSEPGIPILPNALDKDLMLLNVQNGTIDLRTGQLKPYSKEDFISKISPVSYDPDATCPRWIQFLDEIFDKKTDLIEYMQRKAGYILSGDTSEEEFDQLYGTGDNGKSKFVNQILHIMGEYQVKANVETIQAASNRTSANAASSDVARLKGARLVTVSEPEKGTRLNEQRVKDWTGRDPITARFLYQEPITFLPEFKLWIYTNYKLRIRGTDNGIWRRVKLVPFEVTVPENLRDRHLDNKLCAESSGILNWMLEGCLKWQKDGLKVPPEILEATKEYREEQDYLADFFNQCCEIGKTFECQFNEVFLVYKAYCKITEIPVQGRRGFVDTLESKKFKKVTRNKGKFYLGIRLESSLHEKYLSLISDTGRVVSDDMTIVTFVVENLLSELSCRESMKQSSQSSQSSPKQHVDSENTQKQSSFSHQQSSGIMKNQTFSETPQITQLSKSLLKVGSNGEHPFGVINNSNFVSFSMWYVEKYQPVYKETSGSETPYTPSMIAGIVSKLFKLTPAPAGGKA